jgi:hypothetical protein
VLPEPSEPPEPPTDIEALVDQVKIIEPNRLVPVFRVPKSDPPRTP